MQLIINISESMINELRTCKFPIQDAYRLCTAIANGIPLPKGHGRLIDADELSRKMYEEAFIKDSDLQRWDNGCWIRYRLFGKVLDDAPTIIEADKEIENG